MLPPLGYTRDTSFLEMVVDIVQELKRANPNLVYGKELQLFPLRSKILGIAVGIDKIQLMSMPLLILPINADSLLILLSRTIKHLTVICHRRFIFKRGSHHFD